MQESSKSSLCRQTCRGLLRANGSWRSMNMNSITIVIIGLLFGMIQPTVSSIIATTLTSQVSTTATITTTTTTSTVSPATTTYSNSLQSTSPVFIRPGSTSGSFYYQAIQVTTYTSGAYTFKSSSSIDTYGCFYQGSFDPYNPLRNLIICDDDSGGGRQFLLNASLYYAQTYTLVVTTYNPGDVGSYWVIATGPATVYMTSITPSTYPTSSTTSPSSGTTTYSDSLQSTCPTFVRPSGTPGNNYYYQAIQVTASTYGRYSFRSNSSIDTYGCFYQGSFDPSYPSQNLVICDDDSGGGAQFLFNANLYYGVTYILVVTTFSPSVTGAYSVIATGPARVSMISITPVATTFSGTLSSTSPMFSRPNGYSSNYYYQAIQLTIYTSGTYIMRSNSYIDTYGCLYFESFDPSDPWGNLLAYDDDSGGGTQFQISRYLSAGTTYVLVVTTSSTYYTGSYSVVATGPGSISMTAINPPRRLNFIEIIAITFGCIMVFVIILSVCIRRRQRQTIANRRVNSSTCNSNVSAQNVYLPGAQRNAAQANSGRPSASPPYVVSTVVPQDLPPSYETYMATAKPYQQ